MALRAPKPVLLGPDGHRDGRLIDVRGTVQGVGFRPFVYRLATELHLDGSVRNAGGHVLVEATGSKRAVNDLIRRLTLDAPPLAHVTSVSLMSLAVLPQAGSGFRVAPSESASAPAVGELPPDVATCDDCIRELHDPGDRRYRYAFINCTNCGPRATIIDNLPYDRDRTVMRKFPLCATCAAEYADPADRRFHAEPIACVHCGPELVWLPTGSASVIERGASALREAVRAIANGSIVAIKGLGGYQLVCDATRPDVVQVLRERKHRLTKPLAVMVRDLDALQQIAAPTPDEVALLTSAARPIVLVRSLGVLPDVVHPATDRVGVFLPYTPLHDLLLTDIGRPVVVTSGNRCDEPMVVDNDDAVLVLGAIADGFLQHDRDIVVRYDDSVAQVIDKRPRMIRRARGYAPTALPLPIAARVPVLGVGAELKHTFTLASAGRAVIGPHTGDLEDVASFDCFQQTLAHLSRLEKIEPRIVAHDLHPGYLSTQYATRFSAAHRMPVQHHHAHIAACAAEFGITAPVIGIAYDGLGFGDDGTLWGGEILICDLTGYRRYGRFSRAPLPGGAAAVKRPARMALGYLFGSESFDAKPGLATLDLARPFLDRLDSREVETVQRMVAADFNSPQTSSAGRLFDAVSSLLAVRDNAGYEGEAAIALENVAADGAHGELPWSLRHEDGMLVYDVRPTLAAVLRCLNEGVEAPVIAAQFHETLIAVTVAICHEARRDTDVRTVCLGGGVFQNRRLASGVMSSLIDEGFGVYLGEQVPTNDGGISFGQAAISAARTRKD